MKESVKEDMTEIEEEVEAGTEDGGVEVEAEIGTGGEEVGPDLEVIEDTGEAEAVTGGQPKGTTIGYLIKYDLQKVPLKIRL